VSSSLRVSSSKMQGEELDSELGKISLHGKIGECLRL